MSISLNDHEQRIKNIDAQIPTISNRITSLEQNQSKVYVFNTANFGSTTSSVDAWQMIDLTNKVPYTISSKTMISGDITMKYTGGYTTGRFHFSLRKQNVDISANMGTNSHGKQITGYFKIINNRISAGIGDQSRYNGTWSFSGLLYFVDSDKL